MSKSGNETLEIAFIRVGEFDRRHSWAAGFQEIVRRMPFLIEAYRMICLAVLRNKPYLLKTFLQDQRKTFTTVSINLIINCVKILVTSITKLPQIKFTSRKSSLLMQLSRTAMSPGRKFKTKCTPNQSKSSTKKRKFYKWTQRSS